MTFVVHQGSVWIHMKRFAMLIRESVREQLLRFLRSNHRPVLMMQFAVGSNGGYEFPFGVHDDPLMVCFLRRLACLRARRTLGSRRNVSAGWSLGTWTRNDTPRSIRGFGRIARGCMRVSSSVEFQLKRFVSVDRFVVIANQR